MKKIAILGANSQLGQTLKVLSKNEEHEFIFLSRKDLDITDKKALSEIFHQLEVHYCINCAAYTDVEGAEKNAKEAFSINAEGVKKISETCQAYNVKLIHISTDYVFDGKQDIPYLSTDAANPINEYGKSKLKGELYIQDQLKHYYIIRTSWLYSLFGKNFLKSIIKKINNDAVLNITTEEVGTPTSCVDLSKFILHLINDDSMPYGIYNFSANGSTTWFGFAQEIVKCFNPKKLDKVTPIGKFEAFAKRPRFSVLNLHKTESHYKKIPNWQKSVMAMVENYKTRIS